MIRRLQLEYLLTATSMSMCHLIESLHLAIYKEDNDLALEIIKKGVNVNLLSSSGRTALGIASQIGNVSIVCLILDAGKFYSTPEDEELDENDEFFCPMSPNKLHSHIRKEKFLPVRCIQSSPNEDASTPNHKCCSPSIDSETCNCSDEVWGIDTSDTNVGQCSDIDTGTSYSLKKRTISPSQTLTVPNVIRTTPAEDCGNVDNSIKSTNLATSLVDQRTLNMPSFTQHTTSTYDGSNIGYYIYEYREEEEDTGESSGPVLSSTEDSDSALVGRHLMLPPISRQSSILLHRTFGRGRANIVSSDSEFETENYHRKRQARHNHHRQHRHDRDHGRHKTAMSPQPSNPFFSMLHSEYISHGLASPFTLKRICDVNQHDVYGRSPLHYAAEQGHAYIVCLLITAGARIDALDADHTTALHLAAQRGLPEVAVLLLDAGAKVNNKMNDKSSPLHIAASRGYTYCVEILLNRGAKIDSLDSSDRTPLFLAVSRAHHKVVKLLISKGARVNIEEIHGYTPLCEAVWQRDLKLVQELLNAKAKVTQSHCLLHHAVLHRHCQLVELLLGAGCIANLRDEKGDTPLIIAARTCQPTVIKLLLKHGANVNYPNGLNGSRPLHEAVEGTRDAQFKDFLTVFQLLMEYGARIDEETLLPGDTPLYRALLLEKNKAAALLIRNGCNVNCSPPSGYTDYLQIVCSRINSSLAYLLVLAGLNIWKCKWLDGNIPNEEITSKVKSMRSNPLQLMDQCRINIRRQFGTRIASMITKLGIPPVIEKYLMYEEISEI